MASVGLADPVLTINGVLQEGWPKGWPTSILLVRVHVKPAWTFYFSSDMCYSLVFRLFALV